MEAVKLLRQRGAGEPIKIAVLLGTGLGALRVAALSIVTNFGAGFSGGNPATRRPNAPPSRVRST